MFSNINMLRCIIRLLLLFVIRSYGTYIINWVNFTDIILSLNDFSFHKFST